VTNILQARPPGECLLDRVTGEENMLLLDFNLRPLLSIAMHLNPSKIIG
jgi:hypothetical protein